MRTNPTNPPKKSASSPDVTAGREVNNGQPVEQAAQNAAAPSEGVTHGAQNPAC